MNRPDRPVVLITGASTGIGLALLTQLSICPYRIIATARASSMLRLSESGFNDGETLMLRAMNINLPAERHQVLQEITDRWGGVDILVNNAGISYRSVIEHMTDSDEQIQLQANYLSPMALTRQVLPRMRAQRWGRIINISSVGGMMAMPTMGSYSASKFALEGASEALWYELKPWNVGVTLIQPGFVHSNSFRNVSWSEAAKKSINGSDDYQVYYSAMGSFIEHIMDKAWATPESIARQVVECMADNNPPLRVPATIDAIFFSMLRRYMPRRFYHWLLYRNLPGVKSWGIKSTKT